jgi:hypothetical protein
LNPGRLIASTSAQTNLPDWTVNSNIGINTISFILSCGFAFGKIYCKCKRHLLKESDENGQLLLKTLFDWKQGLGCVRMIFCDQMTVYY